MKRETTPVLIVGCGPVGLTMSLLLARQNVAHILIEKRGKVSTLPRARGVTARTVEIWNQLGLGETLENISLPPLWTKYFIYTTTLGGDIIGRMHTEGMQPGALAAHSPFDYKVAAQDQIDPMLYDAAQATGRADIRFNTELLDCRDEGDRVIATLSGPDGEYEVEAKYAIGADGGKSTLRRLAGIAEGKRLTFASYVNNHVRADLSRFTEGREATLLWTMKDGAEGLFQMLDGKTFWAIQVQYDPATDTDEWTPERGVEGIRRMIGHPDADKVEFEVLRTYTYTISSMAPERIRSGRMLLIGDAAHQIPPFGGFGMNTGIQTAHNLAWKLVAALKGEAPDAIFDSFNNERLEVAHRVTEFGRINAGHLERIKAAMKVALTDDERQRLVESTRTYGNWNGLDLGVHYESGAFTPDDVVPPKVENPVTDYTPHAKPGWRAPHMWMKRAGERVSTIMLFDRFVLLAGAEGQAWIDAAASASPAITTYRVGPGADLEPEGDFSALFGVSLGGAVLVRPDGHVSMRAQAAPADAHAVLKKALDDALCRV